MNDSEIENEIREKGKTAPRVTPADIEAEIASEHCFTAAEGFVGAQALASADITFAPSELRLLTFCVLVLRNGFTVTGESACASQENFDAEIGRKLARANAVQKVWPLLGYALKQQMHEAKPTTFQERVIQERNELQTKINALALFSTSKAHAALSDTEQQNLRMQHGVMIHYSAILADRIAGFGRAA